ncbi:MULTISPECIES: MerR family transcriptional regulator [Streptomycetaceae]|uniref:MerR family transcriptional regulator n=1 Tax=Streptantibioticus cattleyicolor (strain ATCC 35852 / DSM 46488 / JCM 4925 / NBRC 14057 / NRRL 8057) TaxID=1003195 RepID=F8JQ49_STREN|nr:MULTISPECIES: MerR family transcriptional regulator [Streptomycetaceae]AEW95312.1 MerR family transcriptional regulator [Streptantibioticus cattleyicolor NRRL 8057 = DSM 46488]MYS59893.1 MerR family transcriptional regulator [Streptomyces sp. SID5468]CCB75656.1 HTH-type transcriptional activator tipA [Streptantibioticus cattleyicolor NRRL 8057 = DSM 46488]
MGYSVGQVAAFTGVTVRTLHHYDRTGLLTPDDRSPAGYRRYDDGDLARLQQILFYRELGFPLEEIAEIMKDPQANAVHHLRARHRALTEQIARLRRLVEVAERAMAVERTGVRLSPEERFEVFGEVGFDLTYVSDAEARYGDSERYRQAMSRAAAHTKEDWRELMAEAADWRQRLLAVFDSGAAADGPAAMELAEEHRGHISRWFTSCPYPMHRRLADDYVTDPRAFALVVPATEQRPGLAAFLHTAIHANAARERPGRADPS